MIIKGKFNTAEVFTNNIDTNAIKQLENLCNQSIFANSKIKIMPDVHMGAGCTIGTTMTIDDKIVPNMLGVDIGCSVTSIPLDIDINLEKIDKIIRKTIPYGFNVHKTPFRQKLLEKYDIYLDNLKCKNNKIKINRGYVSVGTLGGGNHFIELNKSTKNDKTYLTVHTGSRGLGFMVASYYQHLAEKYHKESYDSKIKKGVKNIVENTKDKTLIGEKIDILKTVTNKIPKEFSYLEGSNMENYIHDVNIMQKYAHMNHNVIMADIIYAYNEKEDKFYNLLEDIMENKEKIESIHNYISIDEMILRKGAISAHKNENLIIPINMKEGIIVGKGKGNSNWNCSAPHGAGRVLSRRKAKEKLNLADVKKEMKGIYTTSLSENTVDEAPNAYKSIDNILNNINDSVEVKDIIKPIYNFKA